MRTRGQVEQAIMLAIAPGASIATPAIAPTNQVRLLFEWTSEGARRLTRRCMPEGLQVGDQRAEALAAACVLQQGMTQSRQRTQVSTPRFRRCPQTRTYAGTAQVDEAGAPSLDAEIAYMQVSMAEAGAMGGGK